MSYVVLPEVGVSRLGALVGTKMVRLRAGVNVASGPSWMLSFSRMTAWRQSSRAAEPRGDPGRRCKPDPCIALLRSRSPLPRDDNIEASIHRPRIDRDTGLSNFCLLTPVNSPQELLLTT